MAMVVLIMITFSRETQMTIFMKPRKIMMSFTVNKKITMILMMIRKEKTF